MFRDARALDRQRTASTFNQAMRRYVSGKERWFTGTVDSVDQRLASCERLLHHATATVARMAISDSGRYLNAAEYLESDRRALIALREDLLTGAAGREDVVGPPGWRSAKSDDDFYNSPEGDEGPTGHPPPPPPHGTTLDPRMKEIHQPGYDPEAANAQHTQQAHDYVDRAYPDLKDNPVGLDPEDIENQQYLSGPVPQHHPSGPPTSLSAEPNDFNYQLRGQEAPQYLRRDTPTAGSHGGEVEPPRYDEVSDKHWRGDQSKFTPNASPGQMSLFNETPHEELPNLKPYLTPDDRRRDRDRKAHLGGTDRRWVELEAARFVAANRDAWDDSHELAVRAATHAETKTSTFPRARSAAISQAFVARVGDLGRQSYRPAVKTAAAFQDFDPQAMFL